jgi:1,4-dihydroxy-2-naphthoate polyprenyltransferase
MPALKSWVRASRLPSQTYIAFPILLGQMVALRLTGSIDWPAFVLAQLFGLFDQLYIVYANDWADVETDQRNTTYNIFSGGSRVIVEGLLSRRAVGTAAIVMAALALATGVGLWVLRGTFMPVALMAAGLALLYGYSYPPFRMSYRGGGETLQMVGVGAVLPMIGYSAQTGSLAGFPWLILTVTLPISLGCAVATSLADEPSDRLSRKHTMSVLLGTTRAQALALMLFAASLGLWLLLRPVDMGVWARLTSAAVPIGFLLLAGLQTGAAPGTGGLTKTVTSYVASNVFFFLAASVALAVG